MSREEWSTSEFVVCCSQSRAEQRPQRLPGCFQQELIFPGDPWWTGEAVPAWGSVSSRICSSAALLGEVFVSYAFTGFKRTERGGRTAGGERRKEGWFAQRPKQQNAAVLK